MLNNSLSIKLQINLVKGYENNLISDEDVVQLLNLGIDLLNLKSIQEMADKTGKSYNGIKNHHPKKVKIGSNFFIIDNE